MGSQGRKCEILAPAGSIEQLKAAVNNGCDSVYLGLESFNARLKAPNFTKDNLKYWIDYCHFFGVKVYVAVNTSIKNNEFKNAWETILFAYDSNADGVIITDLALIKLAGKLPKPFDVVASTQLNVHDRYGAELVKKLGATTVVCSRECSFDDIEQIASAGIKVECFLHGALCVSQSGQCLFSSMVGGNSGNRGLCAQPCRKLYGIKGSKSKSYLLSARDICSIKAAKKLSEIGVSVFKIEGRNRRAEYAGITARVYGKLFDRDFRLSDGDISDLKEMYNRGLSENIYLYGKNSDVIYPDVQNHSGVAVGKVVNGGFFSDTQICKGDGLKVFYNNKEVCGGIALSTGKGFIKAEFADKVSDGMTVCRTTSVALCSDVLAAKRTLNVSMKFYAKAGENAKITAVCGDSVVEVAGDFIVEKSHNSPISNEEIVKQLQKIGDSHYTISDIAIETGEVFLAKSQINALRRNVFDKLTKQIIENYDSRFAARKARIAEVPPTCSGIDTKPSVAVICGNARNITEAKKYADLIVYKPSSIDENSVKDVSDCYLDLPSFADLDYCKDILQKHRIGLMCHNVGQVELARELNLPYIAGSGLNLFNDRIIDVFGDADTFVYSQELTFGEISDMSNRSGYVFVDGELILMKLQHCPFKVAYGYDCFNCKAEKGLTYVDEMGNEFEIRRRKDSKCRFELINGKKLSVCNKVRHTGRYLIDYNERIAQHYAQLNKGVFDGYVEIKPYTKGRLYSKIT